MSSTSEPPSDPTQQASGRGELQELSKLRAIPQPRYGVNKNGRLVLRGAHDRQDVKIYETANPVHAAFVREATGHPSIAALFPEVFATRGAFVIAAWAEGRSPRRHDPTTLAAIHARLHRVAADELPEPGFDYWKDHILPRFARAVSLVGQRGRAEEINERVTELAARHPAVLSHPDLSPSNILYSHRQPIIIDNELLGVSAIPLLDVCNTAYSLGRKRGQRYVNRYLAQVEQPLSPQEYDHLGAAWLARRVGGALIEGDLDAVVSLLRSPGDQRDLPFTPPPADTP